MKKKDLPRWLKTPGKVHKTWFEFCNYFKRWYFEYYKGCKKIKKNKDGSLEVIYNKRKLKSFTSKNMLGWSAMMRVERYAKTHKEIKIVRCDDGMHSSSLIVLVPHPTMGITCIYIPQNETNQPNQFFLYPDNSIELLKEITKMRKKCKRKDEE
jgi:hypothetical protein